MSEYNTTEVEKKKDAKAKKKAAEKEALVRKDNAPTSKQLEASRSLGKQLEKDNIRDNLDDEAMKERMNWERPGGLKDKKEKHAPKDAKYDSGIMNVLTSSDPLGGVDDLISERIAYNIAKSDNYFHHKKTEQSMDRAFEKKYGMTKDDARLMANVVSTEVQYGTDALDRARSKVFMDNKQSDNEKDQGPSVPF